MEGRTQQRTYGVHGNGNELSDNWTWGGHMISRLVFLATLLMILLCSARVRQTNAPGDVHAKADAEDGGLGLLRCEDAPGAARQVRRHGGDSDADYFQPGALGKSWCSSRAGRAIAARYHRPGERERPRRAHSYRTDL